MIHDLKLLGRMWPHARPDAWVFIYALVVTPAIAALSLAQPWFIKQVIDENIVPGDPEGLGRLALLYFAAVAGSYLIEATYTLAIAWGGQRMILRMRSSLFRHALSLKQTFFDRQPAGKLLTRLTSDLDSLGDALGAGVVTILLDLIMIIGTATAMFWLNWKLTIVMMVLTPLLLGLIELLRRKLKQLYLETRESLAMINAFLAERIDGVQVLQLFGAEEKTKTRFEKRNRRFRDLTSLSNVYDSLMYAVVDGASSIFVAVILAYGAGVLTSFMGFNLFDGSTLTAGLLVAFIDYLGRLFRPLRDASGKIAVIQRAVASLQKIDELFGTAEPAAKGDISAPEIKGHVVIKDLYFRYVEDHADVLKGIDLEVKPGEVVAIVGATGSGKTTLGRLLDKSYQGYRGKILLDGMDLSRMDVGDLRRQVCAVRQDIQLFSETLAFNVDLGNPNITEEDRQTSASLVLASEVVSRVGWDHVLQERGVDLSVGEGQLVTFARTMAHDPQLVIMDEATASVDSLTEKKIQEAIAVIISRKTAIVIAHRLSTIRQADRIIVMDAGRIVEQGTHEELLAGGGAYAALLDASMSSTESSAADMVP
jgi:ATP-binding cassette subfamily B multidrug efflux pump